MATCLGRNCKVRDCRIDFPLARQSVGMPACLGKSSTVVTSVWRANNFSYFTILERKGREIEKTTQIRQTLLTPINAAYTLAHPENDETCDRLDTSPAGLMRLEAAKRLQETGPNELQAARRLALWEILWGNELITCEPSSGPGRTNRGESGTGSFLETLGI